MRLGLGESKHKNEKNDRNRNRIDERREVKGKEVRFQF